VDQSSGSRTFNSIDQIRSEFYPDSAALLDIDAEEVVGLPIQLSNETLRSIQRVASANSVERVARQRRDPS
jgi:hypothetical protein